MKESRVGTQAVTGQSGSDTAELRVRVYFGARKMSEWLFGELVTMNQAVTL